MDREIQRYPASIYLLASPIHLIALLLVVRAASPGGNQPAAGPSIPTRWVCRFPGIDGGVAAWEIQRVGPLYSLVETYNAERLLPAR